MSRTRLAVALLAATLLGSCGELAPYPTAPRPLPVKLGASSPLPQKTPAASRVGICYNTLTTTLAEVREQAQRECPANTVAEQTDTDWYLENCPLLLPARGTFACTRRK
jgi:hypothetical protein